MEATPRPLALRKEALTSLGVYADLDTKLVYANNARGYWLILKRVVDAGVIYRTDLRIVPSIEARFVVDPDLHSPIQILCSHRQGHKSQEQF